MRLAAESPLRWRAAELEALQAEFPGWLIILGSFASDYWFEATRRPACTSTSCNCCSIVASTATRVRELIITASAPASEQPLQHSSRT
jgi:hypothetical protein